MSWAKLDDRFHGNPKIRQAWKEYPACIGLHVMAITHSAQHELDGRIPERWIADMIPHPKARKKAVSVLVASGLWTVSMDGAYVVHDYLKFNPSRAQLESKREKDRIRKAKSGGFRAEGFDSGAHPVPSRPDPTTEHPPNPPQAGGRRGRVRTVTKDGVFDPSKPLDDLERAAFARIGVELPEGATAADAESACEAGA